MSRDRNDRDAGAPQARRVTRRKRVYSRPISVPPGAGEVIRNPVHTRVELRSDGDPVAVDMVFCKRQSVSLPLSSCNGCKHAVSLPNLSEGESSVTCNAVGPLTSRDADLVERSARVPLAELGRRKFACIRPDTGWETMEALLLDEGMEALPVVDEDRRPIGIVSKSDLMRWARDGMDEVAATELPHATHVDTHPNASAGEMMTPVVHALPEDAPLSFAIALLAMENVDQVPILSQQGEVVGLFAARDAVRWLAQELGYVVRSPGD